MKYVYSFLAAAVVMIALDAVWLKFVLGNIFKSQLGEIILSTPRWLPAALFYLLYAAGIVMLVVVPNAVDSRPDTALYAAVLGLVAYGTYELSNMATLKPWAWHLVALDMTWGAFATVLSALAARAAYLAAQ